MIEKLKKCKRKFSKSAYIVCSFDGAVHGETNVILFDKQMLSEAMKKETTTTTVKNILMWQQMKYSKNVYAILEAAKE